MVECVSGTEVLLTSLPGPPQVEAVLGEALEAMTPGALAVDMSTSSLAAGRRVARAAAERGIEFVDAPVAGQTIGADAGTLAIYVGGTDQGFARAQPVLEAIGAPDRIFHVGPAGSGYTVKLLLNLMWFVQAAATAEALAIGVKAGVSLDKLHEALVALPRQLGVHRARRPHGARPRRLRRGLRDVAGDQGPRPGRRPRRRGGRPGRAAGW